MGRPPIGKTAMTGAERMRRLRARQAQTFRHGKPVTKPDAGLKAQIAALERELAQAKQRSELERQHGRGAVGSDQRILRLEEELALERREHRAIRGFYESLVNEYPGIMSRKDFMKIVNALHPDKVPASERERYNEATRILMQYKDVLVRRQEREPPSWQPRPVNWDALKRMAKRKQAEKRKASRPAPPRPPRKLPR